MKHLFLILSFLISSSVTAADLGALTSLFRKEFNPGYTEGKCGENVQGFVKKAQQLGINIQGVLLLEIEQGGNLYVYHARSNYSAPGSRVFFHHYAIVVSQNNMHLDAQDVVFDFDFGNQPRIVPLREYFEAMLMSPKLHGKPELVKQDFEMGLTKFNVINAQALINSTTPSQRKSALLFKELKMKDLYPSLL